MLSLLTSSYCESRPMDRHGTYERRVYARYVSPAPLNRGASPGGGRGVMSLGPNR